MGVVVLQAVRAQRLVHAVASERHGHAAAHGQRAQQQDAHQLQTQGAVISFVSGTLKTAALTKVWTKEIKDKVPSYLQLFHD